MKLALTWWGVLLLGAAIARGVPPLFPVQDGNYWILESSLRDQKIIRCEPGTNKFLQITGLSDRPVTFYGSAKSPKLFRWGLGKPIEFPVPPPAGGGELYRRQKPKIRSVVNLRPFRKGQSSFPSGDHPCDDLLIQLEPVAVPIRTRVGFFTDCSVLWITTADQPVFGVCDLLDERIYFAPGVGPVAIQGRLDRVYLLVEAQIGDTVIGGQ